MHQNPSAQEIAELLRSSRSIAVVGLSEKPYRTSYRIARAMQDYGYEILPVNPNLRGPVLGAEPYSKVSDIREPVDIVNVFRRSEEVMPVAKDAVAAGARALWMQVGVINEEAAAYAAGHDLIVIMDRCIMVDYASLIAG
ncbi:MAG: CoA-binding protein [Actinomycetota bacterium]